MRISNISQYLGGADNVIAKEITVGDRFAQRVATAAQGGDNIRFDAATWDINFALYKATVAARGSSISLTSFVEDTAAISKLDFNSPANEIGEYITGTGDGSFNVLVREDMLSQFGDKVPTADATNPYVVIQTVRFKAADTDPIIAGEIRTLRFMWIIRYTPLANNA